LCGKQISCKDNNWSRSCVMLHYCASGSGVRSKRVLISSQAWEMKIDLTASTLRVIEFIVAPAKVDAKVWRLH